MLNLLSFHKELENWTNYVKQVFSDSVQQAVQDRFLGEEKRTNLIFSPTSAFKAVFRGSKEGKFN